MLMVEGQNDNQNQQQPPTDKTKRNEHQRDTTESIIHSEIDSLQQEQEGTVDDNTEAGTEPSAELTQVSDMVDFAKTQQLRGMMEIDRDKDLDSLNHKRGVSNTVPQQLNQNDTDSVASSLTNNSIQSERSDYTNFTSSTANTGSINNSRLTAQGKKLLPKQLFTI